eukprot:403119_1
MSWNTNSQLNKLRETADIQELIVSGYINSIQKSLSTQQLIIPNEIYIVCYHYYWSTILIFVHKINYSNNWSEFGIFDTVNMTVSRVGLNKFKRKTFGSTFCFIPNISSYIKSKSFNNNIIYNGIFSMMKQDKGYDYYSTLLLFNQSYMYYQTDYSINYNQNKFQYELKSNKLITDDIPQQIIFCGHKNGIIYENDLQLYSLQFKNIKLNNKNNFKFRRIGGISNTNNLEIIFSGGPLHLLYLSDINRLFMMSLNVNTNHSRNYICGLYDFTENICTVSTDYVPNYISYDAIQVITCYDKIKNRIYQTNSLDYTALYDLHKEKWKKICKCVDAEIFSLNEQKLWCDPYQPNILYVLHSLNRERSMSHKYCDLRENKPKWKKLNKMKTDYFQNDLFNCGIKMFT